MSETSGMPRYTTAPRAVPVVGNPEGWQLQVVDAVQAVHPAAVESAAVDRGELTIHVDPASLLAVAGTLRDDPSLRFEFLASLSGADYLGTDERRLHVVYHLLSMTYRRRIRVEVAVTAENPHVPSVVSVWPTADWQERETWDFFGVVFDGHPALTRIEMPDDWEGHPQRKDYALGGVPVEYKGAQVPPPEERRPWA